MSDAAAKAFEHFKADVGNDEGTGEWFEVTQDQIEAMRGWLALGGRLVIVGGTAGPAVLSGFPDAILPYRPATTVEVAPDSLAVMLGAGPEDAAPDYATTDVPALTGELARGRALATSGDAVIAADLARRDRVVGVVAHLRRQVEGHG